MIEYSHSPSFAHIWDSISFTAGASETSRNCRAKLRNDIGAGKSSPDFANDQIQPYPSLKNPDGSNVTIENLRRTHLFGYKGCSNDDANAIGDAYIDFLKLANQLKVYNQIDWDDQMSIFRTSLRSSVIQHSVAKDMS